MKSIENSHLSINAFNLICEIEKKSIIVSIAKVSKFIRTTYVSAKLKASRLSLSLNTFEIVSESTKIAFFLQNACVRTRCRQCKLYFNFNYEFFEHIRKHEALKIIKNSHFSIDTIKSTCEVKKKSAINDSIVLLVAFATSRSKILSTAMFSQFVSSKRSSLSIATLKITSKLMKKLSFNCSLTFSLLSFRISV